MASQTPGAIRAEGLGTTMRQMAAGATSSSNPRFDAHLQRDIHQSPCAPMGGVSPNDGPLPNGYPQENHQNQPQFRYSMASMGPGTHTPFVSQKAADPLYNLPFSSEHPNSNANSTQPPRQSYAIDPENTPSEMQHQRSSSSGSNGNGRWPAMYAMHPDHRQASQSRSQQTLSAHCTSFTSDACTHLFHVAATM